MSLTKATIEILSRRGEVIEVQFNPNTLAFKKDVVVAEIGIPGLNSPIIQYIRGEAETLDFDLFCDTTSDGMAENVRDVREFTAPIRRLVEIDPASGAIPVIRFRWGRGLSFTAVIVRVEQSFTLFSPAGVPLRARLQLSLKEFKTIAEQLVDVHREVVVGRPPNSQTLPDPRHSGLVPVVTPAAAQFQVRLDAKPLGDEFSRDLLGLTLRDGLDGQNAFELTVNNWDEQRRELKHSDASPFDVGIPIEIFLGETAGKSARPAIKGTIETVRQSSPADGRSILVVSGSATIRSPTKRSVRRPLHLERGKSLIQFEPVLRLARPVRKAGRKVLRSRVELSASGASIGIPELLAGTLIEIHGYGKRFGGEYVVTGTTHTIGDSGYTTRFECHRPER